MRTAKIINPRIKTLKKIEQDQEAAVEKVSMLEKKRRQFLETLFENPIRMTEVTEEVTELLQKAEKNPLVKPLLNAHRISLKEVALVLVWDEEYIGQKWDCPAHNSWNAIFQWNNAWSLRWRYAYGSPKDQIKLIFRRSRNERNYFCGFITNFPMKYEKRKAA